MAVKRKAAGDGGLGQLKEALSSGSLGTVYLFHGEESYLREYYLSEMKNSLVAGFENFNFHKLEGKGLTVQALTETVEAMPMMAQRTMVQVVDWDLYKLSEEQRTGFIALLEDFPPYCCLVIVYDQIEYKPSKTYKKLYAALEAYAQTVKFQEQSQNEILKWVARRFKAAGHTIDVPTAEHLLFTCGSLMNGLIPEIGKIAAYAKNERVTKADVDAVAACWRPRCSKSPTPFPRGTSTGPRRFWGRCSSCRRSPLCSWPSSGRSSGSSIPPASPWIRGGTSSG